MDDVADAWIAAEAGPLHSQQTDDPSDASPGQDTSAQTSEQLSEPLAHTPAQHAGDELLPDSMDELTRLHLGMEPNHQHKAKQGGGAGPSSGMHPCVMPIVEGQEGPGTGGQAAAVQGGSRTELGESGCRSPGGVWEQRNWLGGGRAGGAVGGGPTGVVVPGAGACGSGGFEGQRMGAAVPAAAGRKRPAAWAAWAAEEHQQQQQRWQWQQGSEGEDEDGLAGKGSSSRYARMDQALGRWESRGGGWGGVGQEQGRKRQRRGEGGWREERRPPPPAEVAAMAGRQRLPEELLACGDVWSMSR